MRSLTVLVIVVGVIAALAPADARRRPRPGFLNVNSTTAGAKVFVDHQEVGETPLAEPIELPVGQHTLKMTKRGYTQFLEVFTIRPGKTTELEIDLLPVAGVLVVETDVKDARVYVDGKFVGTTPLETEVLIGKRAIRVRKAGYYDHEVTRATIAGQSQTVKVQLVPLPVGTSPYRPPPPPPPKWYEKWWVWASIGGGVAAVALTVSLSVTMASKDEISDFGPQYHWKATGLSF